MEMHNWSTTAVNLAEHADNPIHTDAGAQAAGFDRALVAGVTTFAAATHLPATAWGIEWVRSGRAFVRFRRPVLDGDRVDFVARDRGEICAMVDGDVRVDAAFELDAAAPRSARAGEQLEPIDFELDASWSDYGRRAGDDCPLYAEQRIAHPSAWPRIANRFCHEQLVDGSWIHVRSDITHLAVAHIGLRIHATANVVERLDSRAGKRAVLDVRIRSDGRDVAVLEHEAIIELA